MLEIFIKAPHFFVEKEHITKRLRMVIARNHKIRDWTQRLIQHKIRRLGVVLERIQTGRKGWYRALRAVSQDDCSNRFNLLRI